MESLTASTFTTPAAAAIGAGRRVAQRLFGEDGFGFKDVLDLVNPLQHIPVVGNLYRKLTGDVLAPAIRVAGGALFGGPLGAGLSLVGLAVEKGVKEGVNEGVASSVAAAPLEVDAPAPPVAVPRGGWLIAAATTGRVDAFAPAAALTSNAAVAAVEASPAAALPLAVTPSPARTATHPDGEASGQRTLHLPVRRALPPSVSGSAGDIAPVAAATPRSDPRALARFAAWQAGFEHAMTRLDERA